MTPSLAEMVGKHVEISTLAHSVFSGWLTRAEEWAPGEWQLVFGDPRNDDDSLYLPGADIEHVVETAPDRDYREITLGGAKLLVCPTAARW